MIKILLIFQSLTGSDPLREWANNKDFSFFLHVEYQKCAPIEAAQYGKVDKFELFTSDLFDGAESGQEFAQERPQRRGHFGDGHGGTGPVSLLSACEPAQMRQPLDTFAAKRKAVLKQMHAVLVVRVVHG